MAQHKILIADDDRALTQALRRRLESAGYFVIVTSDAYSALASATRDKPDLLILDVHMPAGEGFSVPSRLARIPCAEMPPIIYLTGDYSLEIEVDAAAVGALAVLHKPINPVELLQVIENVLMPKAA